MITPNDLNQRCQRVLEAARKHDVHYHRSEIASAFSLLVDELADVEDFARIVGQGEMARALGYLRGRVATVAINLSAEREGGAR